MSTSSFGGKAGRFSKRGGEQSTGRPVAWWPFWGAFLLIAAAVGVAIGHGEMQMQSLRASVDTLHTEMSALTTNLESRGDQFTDILSQAEFRLASTVEEALSLNNREGLASSGGTGSAAGAGGGGVSGAADALAISVLADADPSPGGDGVYVRVRPGDSLWEISRALWGRGSLYPTLARENELDPEEPLPVDALLRIPPVAP